MLNTIFTTLNYLTTGCDITENRELVGKSNDAPNDNSRSPHPQMSTT